MQLALPRTDGRLRSGFRLPPVVPPFNTLGYRLFTALWALAFLLAVAGPLAGLYDRYTEARNNSQLLLGSRAGFAVSPADATLVRFTVGPQAKAGGVVPGDHIVAIYGLPLPATMPTSQEALAEHGDDPAYIAMGNLLYGSDESEIPLTVRDPSGRVRDVTVTTGEHHIDAGAKALGISPKVLSFIDLLQVIFYPFLLWAAWLLHRRNSRDVVSSILSLAVLLSIGAEQPSTIVPGDASASRVPSSWRSSTSGTSCSSPESCCSRTAICRGVRSALIACLPLLMFLHDLTYKTYFVGFMIIGVLVMVRGACADRIRASSGSRSAGLCSGSAPMRCCAASRSPAIYLKWSTDSFGQQLLVEMGPGISFALAALFLQLGLLIALLRYRLYDAEIAIGRSVNFAVITLGVAAVFAAAGDALKQIVYNYSGNTSNEGPIIFAAALATIMVNPIQERVQRWSEKRFQKHLFLLRNDLPQSVRDMRETASLDEMVGEILAQVDRGVRAVRSPMIVNGCVLAVRGIGRDEVDAWRTSVFAQDYKSDICEASDRIFPIRVPLIPSSDQEEPIGYLLVGPRPDGSVASRDEQNALAEVSEEWLARSARSSSARRANRKSPS